MKLVGAGLGGCGDVYAQGVADRGIVPGDIHLHFAHGIGRLVHSLGFPVALIGRAVQVELIVADVAKVSKILGHSYPDQSAAVPGGSCLRDVGLNSGSDQRQPGGVGAGYREFFNLLGRQHLPRRSALRIEQRGVGGDGHGLSFGSGVELHRDVEARIGIQSDGRAEQFLESGIGYGD